MKAIYCFRRLRTGITKPHEMIVNTFFPVCTGYVSGSDRYLVTVGGHEDYVVTGNILWCIFQKINIKKPK